MSEKPVLAPTVPSPRPLKTCSRRRPSTNILQTEALVALLVAPPLTLALTLAYGTVPAWRLLVGLCVALLLQSIVIRALRRRIGPERTTPADLLTLLRASTGGILLGLAVAGISDRTGFAGWLACIAALLAATVCDWVDGPLARRFGPTRLGAVLDIESDSWLTLWCATGAIVWGGLPWICVLPPLARYALPARALLRGHLPAGGGPWWSRVTGVAQMALLLAALVPIEAAWRDTALTLAAIPISAAQLITIAALLLLSET